MKIPVLDANADDGMVIGQAESIEEAARVYRDHWFDGKDLDPDQIFYRSGKSPNPDVGEAWIPML